MKKVFVILDAPEYEIVYKRTTEGYVIPEGQYKEFATLKEAKKELLKILDADIAELYENKLDVTILEENEIRPVDKV